MAKPAHDQGQFQALGELVKRRTAREARPYVGACIVLVEHANRGGHQTRFRVVHPRLGPQLLHAGIGTAVLQCLRATATSITHLRRRHTRVSLSRYAGPGAPSAR